VVDKTQLSEILLVRIILL